MKSYLHFTNSISNIIRKLEHADFYTKVFFTWFGMIAIIRSIRENDLTRYSDESTPFIPEQVRQPDRPLISLSKRDNIQT